MVARNLPSPWRERFTARAAVAIAGTRAVLRLHGRIVRQRNRELRYYDLTSARMRILEVIHEHAGGSISEIARQLDLSRQAVHRVVHDLGAVGLLKLRPSERDRRARIPVLNSFGEASARFVRNWQELAGDEVISTFELTDVEFATSLAHRIGRRLDCAAAVVYPSAELLAPGGGP